MNSNLVSTSGRYNLLMRGILWIEDFIIINVSYVLLLSFFERVDLLHSNSYQSLLLFINLGYLFALATNKVLVNAKEIKWNEVFMRAMYRVGLAMVFTIVYLFLSKTSGDISRLFIISYFLLLFIFLFFARIISLKTMLRILGNQRNRSNAIILGAGSLGRRLHREIAKSPYLGIHILGIFDDNPTTNHGDLLGNINDVKDYICTHQVSRIYCTLPLSAKEKILDLLEFSELHVVNFHIVPTVRHYSETPLVLEMVGEMPVLSVRKVPLSYAHNAFYKRCFDFIISLLFLITLFPFIFIILGALIKLSSKGHVFFVQERTGEKGKSFKCYKFRSMQCSADANTKQATVNDSRKTKVGNFLRKTNLDELPQFINVLKGDMSIVGPRPHMLLHTSEYANIVNKYMVRHFIKPGITGWAQVNGFRGETKELELMEGRIKKDIWYIENWSLWLDIEIMIKTVWVTIKGDKKAY